MRTTRLNELFDSRNTIIKPFGKPRLLRNIFSSKNILSHVGSSTYGWVYVQKNLNTEDKSSGDHVMTISSFTSRYMGGQGMGNFLVLHYLVIHPKFILSYEISLY